MIVAGTSLVRFASEPQRAGGENGAPRVSLTDLYFVFAGSVDLVTSNDRLSRHDEHRAVVLTRVGMTWRSGQLFGGGEPFTCDVSHQASVTLSNGVPVARSERDY